LPRTLSASNLSCTTARAEPERLSQLRGTWKAAGRTVECTWDVLKKEGRLLGVVYNFNAIDLAESDKRMKITLRASGRVIEFER
jgi:hypothetical protein